MSGLWIVQAKNSTNLNMIKWKAQAKNEEGLVNVKSTMKLIKWAHPMIKLLSVSHGVPIYKLTKLNSNGIYNLL